MSSTRTDLGARVLTYAELLAREGDEETRRELLEGELHVTPAPNLAHQRIVRNLGTALHLHVTARALGEVFFAPTDVVLDEHNVLQPDVLFVSTARASLAASGKHVAGAPDLVVEVISPSRPATDLGEKLITYQRHGVQNYWVLDPTDHLLREFVLTGKLFVLRAKAQGAATFAPAVFPDLTLALGDVWA